MSNTISEKKKALLAYKEKILQEIHYCDKSIEQFRAKHKSNSYYEDADSSDSDSGFPITIDLCPEIPQLKLQQSTLKTCLQATQELTSLTVLQSEVNVLVQAPELDGQTPVIEAGRWQEVTAECRIDLVPFSIAFYMHVPFRKFAPTSSRSLQVCLVKSSHEIELANSVLHTLKRPSDAIEVIRSYAAAYRSRRTTLARLVNKYANSLFMEAHPEGGFILKCANLLEILWKLENKWSPVAPFHHRMKFDLEYMEESYIKIITQAHKQLLDPSIDTDERTLLLSKIISTCLEARGPVDSESDLESRQTDTQPEGPIKDSEVMAPPKSLPKKSKKIVGKENIEEKTGPKKRNVEDMGDGDGNAKKIRVIEEGGVKKKVDREKNTKNKENNDLNANMIQNKETNDDLSAATKAKMTKNTENTDELTTGNKKAKTVKNKENNDVNTEPKVKITKNNDDLKTNGKKAKTNDIDKLKKKSDEIEVVEKVGKKSKTADNNVNKEKNDGTEINNKQNKNVETKIAKKRKNDDNALPNEAKTNEVVKKVKTTEEKQNKNTENSDTGHLKAKSNTNIPKNAVKPNDAPKKVKSKTFNEETNHEPNENEEINNENAKDNIKNSKTNDGNKKLDRKSKMSIANDKKIDIVAKKMTGNIENKSGNPKPKNVDKNQVKNVVSSKKPTEDKDINKNIDTKTTKIDIERLNNKKTDTKNVASKNIPGLKQNSNNNEKKSTEQVKNKNTGSTKDLQNKNTVTKIFVSTKNPTLKRNSNDDNPKLNIPAKNKITGNTKDIQTMKKVTEKHATNNKNKDKILNKVGDKGVSNKSSTSLNKELKMITKPDKKMPKFPIKSIRNITHKSPSNKNGLKIQNVQKSAKTKISNGNTKMFTGSTEKENGGISKIPQKKLSNNSENLRNNVLRISPRKLPSKLKTTTQASTKLSTKSTNIPSGRFSSSLAEFSLVIEESSAEDIIPFFNTRPNRKP